MSLLLNTSYLKSFLSPQELENLQPQVTTAHQLLKDKVGAGNDYLGWVNLPTAFEQSLLLDLQQTAEVIRQSCDILVVIGIGGSYLGARAAIEFLRSPNYNQVKDAGDPEIYFVGNHMSASTLQEVQQLCEGKDICVNVISKSGTTTEPAIAFRIFRELLIQKYGAAESAKRIICTTDKSRGTLKKLADENGYKTFVIPDDVGGRYSVLTPVGLLPIAVAGCDIAALLEGAKTAEIAYQEPSLAQNDCYCYAAIRNILSRKGKSLEILVAYEPYFALFGEWFKQLYGESEGKDHKGIFPASMIFSTDLHSLGQYVQQGARNLFETVVDIRESRDDFAMEKAASDYDGLNFLAGMKLSDINRKAMQGTLLAHVEGGVPNLIIELSGRDEHHLGQLIYFFEKACAISGYLLGVNPFDQPGVEDYKRNMFALLGKPGFEQQKKELEARL